MSALIEVLAWLAGGVVAMVGALLWGRREGRQQERARRSAEEAQAGLTAERQRQEIEDEIQQDADLAGRARRNGLVRPDR